MKHKRILTSTLGLIAGIASLAPASAFAGGPLLSGYGGPGAGDQAILGATLIGGPSGGSGGSGNSGAGSGGSVALPSSGSSGTRGGGPASSSGAGGGAHGAGSGSHGSSTAGVSAGTATQRRAAGANPQSSTHLEGLGGVTTDAAAESWFSEDDSLALVLVAGVLALVAIATVRLARAEHG